MMHTLLDQPALERIRAEYLEMPALSLKADQIQRLCGVDREGCKNVLDALVELKFLRLKLSGTYVRLIDGEILSSASGEGRRCGGDGQSGVRPARR